jgi:hypothetical protein
MLGRIRVSSGEGLGSALISGMKATLGLIARIGTLGMGEAVMRVLMGRSIETLGMLSLIGEILRRSCTRMMS